MDCDEIWNSFFGSFDEKVRETIRRFESLPSGAYGYVGWQGPDGVRHEKEFGSPQRISGTPIGAATDEGDSIRAEFELPGAEKQDIRLTCTGNSVRVSVSTPGRETEKSLALPSEIDTDTAKAEYNNGILEITAKKAKPRNEEVAIAIE